jgi:hypothetical protein
MQEFRKLLYRYDYHFITITSDLIIVKYRDVLLSKWTSAKCLPFCVYFNSININSRIFANCPIGTTYGTARCSITQMMHTRWKNQWIKYTRTSLPYVRRLSDVTGGEVGDITLNKGELPMYPKDVTLISDGFLRIIFQDWNQIKQHPHPLKFPAKFNLFIV